MGPLTLKQFLYLAAAGAFSFILFFVLQTWLWVMLTLTFAMIAVVFAFIRYNGRSLPVMFLAAIKFFWQPKFYIWHYVAPGAELPTIHSIPKQQVGPAAMTKNPLKNLLLKLQTSTHAIIGREKTIPPSSPDVRPGTE